MPSDATMAALENGLNANNRPTPTAIVEAFPIGLAASASRLLQKFGDNDAALSGEQIYRIYADQARKLSAELPADRDAALFILDAARELFLSSFAYLNQPLKNPASVLPDVAGQPSNPGWENALRRPI